MVSRGMSSLPRPSGGTACKSLTFDDRCPSPSPGEERNITVSPSPPSVDRPAGGIVDETDNLIVAQETESRAKWNFDFITCTPLDGRYEWTPVERPTSADVPSLSRADLPSTDYCNNNNNIIDKLTVDCLNVSDIPRTSTSMTVLQNSSDYNFSDISHSATMSGGNVSSGESDQYLNTRVRDVECPLPRITRVRDVEYPQSRISKVTDVEYPVPQFTRVAGVEYPLPPTLDTGRANSTPSRLEVPRRLPVSGTRGSEHSQQWKPGVGNIALPLPLAGIVRPSVSRIQVIGDVKSLPAQIPSAEDVEPSIPSVPQASNVGHSLPQLSSAGALFPVPHVGEVEHPLSQGSVDQSKTESPGR